MNEILVSVLCLTYNHEKYIRKALEGFVAQKTNFKFEVLIHDDASTDRTADIIREYEEKYPEIIKPIYQTKNQYSKGVKIGKIYQLPRAQGKYLAWCEGDDYWIDPYKLQKQVEYMESHPDCSCCTHGFVETNHQTGESENKMSDASRYYSFKEVVEGGGGMFATASIVMRKDFYLKKPEFYSAKGFGDYQLIMYAAAEGNLYHIKDVMSVYNLYLPGSWTSRNYVLIDKRLNHLEDLLELFNKINAGYNYRYNNIFDSEILEVEYQIDVIKGNYKSLRAKKYNPIYKSKTLKGKIGMILLSYTPRVYKLIKLLKTGMIKK